VSWLYWNMRVYRYDRKLQKLVVTSFWDGVNSSKPEGPPLNKGDLQ